ncbi:hypothetical protein GCM10020295_05650 [Streptomyces cinereospinus]
MTPRHGAFRPPGRGAARGGTGRGAPPGPVPPPPAGPSQALPQRRRGGGAQALCAWCDCRHWYRTPSWWTVAPAWYTRPADHAPASPPSCSGAPAPVDAVLSVSPKSARTGLTGW